MVGPNPALFLVTQPRHRHPDSYFAVMRYALAAAILATATVANAAGSPSTPALQRSWGDANGACQGSSDPEGFETKVACQKRDFLGGRLAERGFCYGLKNQSTSQYRWHKCTPASMQSDD